MLGGGGRAGAVLGLQLLLLPPRLLQDTPGQPGVHITLLAAALLLLLGLAAAPLPPRRGPRGPLLQDLLGQR